MTIQSETSPETVLWGQPLDDTVCPVLNGRNYQETKDPDLYQSVCVLISAVFEVSFEALFANTRCVAPVAFSRQVAIYLVHIIGSKTYSEIGSFFGRDRTTAAHACRIVEDQRDDPVIDRLLDHLEQSVTYLLAVPDNPFGSGVSEASKARVPAS